MRDSILVLVFMAIMTFLPCDLHFAQVHAVLTENGICTNGKVTIGNETQILNLSAAVYIKKLTSDN